jgi:hypothetical protein
VAGDKKSALYITILCGNLLDESDTGSEDRFAKYKRQDKKINYLALAIDSLFFRRPTPTNFLAQYSSKTSLIITPPLVDA